MRQANTGHGPQKLAQAFIHAVAVIAGFVGLYAIGVPDAILAAFPAHTPGIPTPHQDYYHTVIIRLRIAGVAAILAAIVLIAVGRWLTPHLARIAFDAWHGIINIAQELRRFMREEDQRHLSALMLILLITIGLRLAFLSQPMRYDEADTFTTYASEPLIVGMADYAAPNNHIFHTLLVYLAYHLLGNQPWVIRLPTFLAGILIIPAGYLLTRRLYDKHAALLAAGLLSASSYLVQYATDARGYTLVTLIFLLLLSVSINLSNGGKGWFAYAILAALGFYTLPVMLYPLGIVALWLLTVIVFKQKRVRLKDLQPFITANIAAAGLTLILYSPVLAISGISALIGNQYVKPLTGSLFFTRMGASLNENWAIWNRDWPAIVSVMLAIGCILSIGWSISQWRLGVRRLPLIVVAIIWCVPVILVQRVVPYSRVWLFLVPIYLITAAIGWRYILSLILTALPFQRWEANQLICISLSISVSVVGMVGVLITRSPYYADETGFFPEAAPVAAFLKDTLQPGDQVYADTPAKAEVIYYALRLGISPDNLPTSEPDINTGRRILVIVDTRAMPIDRMVAARFEDGSPVLPKLIMEYQSAQVYQVQYRPSSAIF